MSTHTTSITGAGAAKLEPKEQQLLKIVGTERHAPTRLLVESLRSHRTSFCLALPLFRGRSFHASITPSYSLGPVYIASHGMATSHKLGQILPQSCQSLALGYPMLRSYNGGPSVGRSQEKGRFFDACILNTGTPCSLDVSLFVPTVKRPQASRIRSRSWQTLRWRYGMPEGI